MSPFDVLHPAIREALAGHEAFRRLNFTPDEIFVGPVGHGDKLGVQVRRGDLRYTVAVALWPGTHAEFARQWTEAVRLWNDREVSEAHRLEIYQSSRVLARSVDLVVGLAAEGFAVRRLDA